MAQEAMKCGGWEAARLPDANVEAITELMKPVVESQSNAIIKQFTAIMYTSQVVNGINYVIKVLTDPDQFWSCIHIHVYQPLPSDKTPVSYKLTKVQDGETLDSPFVPLTPIIPPIIKPGHLLGGLSQARLADAQVQAISYQIRPAVEKSAGEKYKEFKPIMYKTQVVAGVNYFIKIQVQPEVPESCIQIRVFQQLPTTELQLAYSLGETKRVRLDSLIVYESRILPPQ